MKLQKRLAVAGVACASLALTLPARAGWDATNGANFSGNWSTTWQSPSGSYDSPLTINGTGAAGAITGTYNNGTIAGTISGHFSAGTRDGWVIDGKWTRTGGGASGGSCAYGRMHLLLIDPSPGSQPPDLTFSGKWSYCDIDPMSDANPQQWTGDQPQQVAFDGYLLPVPLYPQLTNMWCWAASGEMVVQYLFPQIDIKQGEEANRSTGRTDCSNDPTPGPDADNPDDVKCIDGGWTVLSSYGVDALEEDELYDSVPDPDVVPADPKQTVGKWNGLSTKGMTFEVLKKHINAGSPVMFAWTWREHPDVDGDPYVSGGHTMVARGWSTVGGENYVYINDPWIPQEGAEEILTYDTWLGGLDQDHLHWADWSSFALHGGAIASKNANPAGGAGGMRLRYIPISPRRLSIEQLIHAEPRMRMRAGVPAFALLRPARNVEAVRTESQRAKPVLRLLARVPQNLRVLGLANPAEADRAEVGDGISEYVVSPGALISYRQTERAETVLRAPASVLAPVRVDGALRSAVRIHVSGRVPKIASYGNAGLIARINRIAPVGNGVAVAGIRMPALGLYFVAREQGGALFVAPVFSTPQLQLVQGRFEPANAVFARLHGLAKRVRGIAARRPA